MKTRHYIFLMAAVGAGLALTSCSDYLDSEKYFKDRTTITTVFSDKSRTEQWLAHAYSYLNNENADVCSKNSSTSQHCFDDDMYYGDRDIDYDTKEGVDLSWNNFHMGNYDENKFTNAWNNCYQGIQQATVFIQHVDENPELTAKDKLDYKGQARFVRAYFYWLLLRRYGPVPIMPVEGVDYNKSYDEIATPRSSYEQVAQFISDEMIQAAKEIQYTKRDINNVARPTKGACLATRAYALIFAASPLANGNDDDFAKAFVDDQGNRLLSPTYDESKWAKAAAACRDVIELGVYDLYHTPYTSVDNGPSARPTVAPPYDPVFSENNWPNGWKNIDPMKSYRDLFDGAVSAYENPELIFSRVDQAAPGFDCAAMALHQMPRSAPTDGSAASGWNTHGMTQKMCDAYYMNDGSDCPGMNSEYTGLYPANRVDSRPRLTGFTTRDDVRSKTYPELDGSNTIGISLQYVRREPRFYASVAYSGSTWNYLGFQKTERHNEQVFYYRNGGNGFMNTQFWLRTGIGIKKWVHPSDYPGNIRVKAEPAIRYADILLLYAEALNELDQSYQISSWDGSTTYTISRDVKEMKRGIQPVRIRAGLPDYSDATYANKDLFRTKLKRERMIELMGEGKRYYDLRRWKDAELEESLQTFGLNIIMDANHKDDFYKVVPCYYLKSTFAPKMYFWPISHAELKHNKRLTQEPGWTTYD